MATIDGARALGMAGQIGSVEAGKKADLALLDFDQPHLYPRHSIASALVYQANGSEVDTVIVDGRVLVAGGQVISLGAEGAVELARSVQEASARVAEHARLTSYKPHGRRSFI
jgi:cytosine/adenosine deaminase-related metal-dependent hydrolase